MMASKLVLELKRCIKQYGDRPVDISVDLSVDEDTAFARLFAIPEEVQISGDTITLLSVPVKR